MVGPCSTKLQPCQALGAFPHLLSRTSTEVGASPVTLISGLLASDSVNGDGAMHTEGVDLAWVRERLQEFVSETRAINQSGGGVITARNAPVCGRDRALALCETVRPILDRLYPEWASENETSKYDEFRQERDAAKRLLARLETHEETMSRLGGADLSPRITAASLHSLIWEAAKAQWNTGHRHEGVLAAAKAVNSLLQAKLARRDVSEGDLIRQAFSSKDPEPGKPRLRFTRIQDDRTRDSMRQGVSDFGAGCFAAIRNPIGHRPNEELEMDEQSALERLAALSLLARWIEEADLEH